MWFKKLTPTVMYLLILQNLDYLIVSGARRQENRWDPTQNGQVVPEDKETSKRLFDDAMFKLEHGTGDQNTAKKVNPTLGRLINRNHTTWRDDFAANSALRAQFRVCFSFMFFFCKPIECLRMRRG